MKAAPHIRAWLRCACAFLLAGCLLPALAPASTARAAPYDYQIKLYDPGIQEMCVGQSATITGSYGPVSKGETVPLLFPTIRVWGMRGSTQPRGLVPGTFSGIFHFNYKAERAGQEEIRAEIVNTLDAVTASASIKINVLEKCAYQYDLNAEMDASASAGEFSEKIKYRLKIKGRLEPKDPAQPNRMESHPTLKVATVMVEYKVPQCALLAPEVGRGTGFVDVYAELVDDGKQVHVWFSPPYQFDWTVNAATVCLGVSINYNKMLNLSTSKDPWIDVTLPAGGGQREVEIDIFEKGERNFWKSGTPASYTAKLTLSKKGSQ